MPALNDYQRNGIPPTLCSEQRFPFLVCCTDLTAYTQKPDLEKTTRRKRLSERKCDEYNQNRPENINTPNCTDDQAIDKAKRGEFPHMAAVGWRWRPESKDIVASYYLSVGVDTGTYLHEVGVDGRYSREAIQSWPRHIQTAYLSAVRWEETYEETFRDYVKFLCSGSLISSRFVLTAKYCARDFVHYPPDMVRLGALDFFWENSTSVFTSESIDGDVPVKTVHVHPEYNSSVDHNYIWLLELEADVNFNDNIRPACLWTEPDLPWYSKAIATGWAFANLPNHPRDPFSTLIKMPYTLLESDSCNETMKGYYREWGVSRGACISEDPKALYGTCKDREGSPLQVMVHSDKCIVHVVGVLELPSWCVDMEQNDVYTPVYSQLDWIEGTVWPGEQ
ncbi:serine protease persephone-like [Bicyclus anynana]|uniref:Serine protease persephone-like n=1 Tax=Bicyclus anynana TaxID=110368 RepID=A0A6J1NYT8_BICAN|nr:serine protease persephone-like [Bicyclus anynana]